MYNVAVEQIISVTPPKKSILYKVILIIACVLAVTTIPSTGLFGLLLLVVLVLFTIFVFRYYKAEYEYSLVDGELTIERICKVFIINSFLYMSNTWQADFPMANHPS